MENKVWFESEQEAREWFLSVLEGDEWYENLCTDSRGNPKRFYLEREYVAWCCAILPRGGFFSEEEVAPLLREALYAHADEVAEMLMTADRYRVIVRHTFEYPVGYIFNEAGEEEPLFAVKAMLCKDLNGKTPHGLYLPRFYPF